MTLEEVIAVQRSHMVCNAARLRWGGALATAVLASAPLAAAAAPSPHGSAAGGVTVTLGFSYGGVTSQNFPVIVDVNKTRRQVVRTVIGILTTCSAGGVYITWDGYVKTPISKRGKFSASFGPSTERNADGTTTDFEGTVTGAFNSSRTKVSGTWTLKATDHDAAGAVTDTCDSGRVTWSAKQ